MLQDLRDQKNSGLIVVLFAIIIIAFVFMFGLPGADSCTSKSHSDVATINSENGSHTIGHDMMRSQILQHYDDNIFGKLEYASTAKEITRALGLIYILADDARAAGLRISDEELHEYITNWEYGNPDARRFYHKNTFSKATYESTLSRMQLSAKDYEDYKRCEFLARRYLTLMSASISVSDETLWQEFLLQNSTTTLEVVRLTNEDVRATLKPLTEEEIGTFETSGATDIEKYYNEHLSEFTIGAKAQLHQIVIQKNSKLLTNPGAKTVRSQLPEQRAAIAKRQVEEGLDFAQAFTDFDESADKMNLGITELLKVDNMSVEFQNALAEKKIGDVVRVDLSDRIVIAKILDQKDKIVKPLAEVKHEIARTLLDNRRISSRRDEAAANLLSLVQGGKTMEEALDIALYANVLTEQPMMPAAVEETVPADSTLGSTPDLMGLGNNSLLGSPTGSAFGLGANSLNIPTDPLAIPSVPAETAEVAMVPVPTDLPIVPEFERAKAKMVKNITTEGLFITEIGPNDDLARDVRNATPGTLLARTYNVNDDLVIVKVVEKTPANRDAFNSMLDDFRTQALQIKQLELVGNIDDILNLDSKGYGLWVKQKLEAAESSGRLKVNNDYFNSVYASLLKRQQEREEMENE